MTDSQLPAPLVPAEVDLRNFPGMWFDVGRLLSSDTWVLGTGEERATAFALWAQSWLQVPAGSLPDDQRLLEHLSMSKKWKASRTHAMRGWVRCNDGRFYHPVVCEKVLEAWIEKLAAAISGGLGNAKRWNVDIDLTNLRAQFVEAVDRLRALDPGSKTLTKKAILQHLTAAIEKPSPPDAHMGSGGESPPDSPPESGRDRSRPDPTGPDQTGSHNVGGEEPPTVSQYGAIAKALRHAGIEASPGTLRFRTLVDAGATVEEFLAMVPDAKSKDRPFAYLLGAVEGERKRAAQTAAQLHRGPMPQAPPARTSAVDRQIATMNALTGKDRTHERPTASDPADVIDVAARTVA